MISFLSNRIALWLRRHKAISEAEIPLYNYAAFLILYTLMPILPILCISILFHIPVLYSILFFLTFLPLRKYTGGFHFHSQIPCLITSTLIEGFFLYLSTLPVSGQTLLPLQAVSCLSLLVWSPVISNKRPLTKKEQRRCKRIAAALLAFFSGICYLLCAVGHTAVAAYTVYAILMTALLQYPAIIQKRMHGK